MLGKNSKESALKKEAAARDKAKKADLSAQEKAKGDLELLQKLLSGKSKEEESAFLKKYFENIKEPLLHKDAEGIYHCYLFELVKDINAKITKENEKYHEEILAGKAKQNNEKAILNNHALLDKLLPIDNALAVTLKGIRDKEDEKDENLLRTSFSAAVEEDAHRRSTLGLQDTLRGQTTDATMHDQEYFKKTYDALEAKVWEERDKRKEKFDRILNRGLKWIQKDGVKTAIRVGGLVAIGVTSGGVGLGVALLSKGIAVGASKAHEAFLEKYYKVPEEYKNHLETFNDNAKFLKGNVDSIATLKLKRDSATGEAKKILDLQIRAVEVSTLSKEEAEKLLAPLEKEKKTLDSKIKALELTTFSSQEKADLLAPLEKEKQMLESQIKVVGAAIELKKTEEEEEEKGFMLLVDLISSRDPIKQEDATKFVDGFAQETRMLQAEGEKAFSNFRENTQNLLDKAQQKSADATRALNAAKSKNSIDKKEYSDLMFNALAAQGAVNDILKPLDESYNQLLEVERRDQLYIKLAQELKKRQSDVESNVTGAEIKNGTTTKFEFGEKSQQVQKVIKDNKLSAQDALVGAATTLLSANDTLQDVGKTALYALEKIKTADLNTVIHDVEFQKRTLDMVATISKETASKSGATEALTKATEAVTKAADYLSGHLSSVLLEGMPSAHLIHDISPAGACTMLALLIYTSAHNKIYSAKLKKNFSEITTLLNNRDISTLDEDELKKLQELVGQTIHEFGNLLPKSMSDHLKDSKAIYEAELERTKLLARATRFSDVVIHHGGLGIMSMYSQAFDKKKVYIAIDPKYPTIITAYYYDGKKWNLKEKTKEEFDKQNFKAQPKNNNVTEVEKISQFFECKRTTLSEKKTKALEASKKNLDEMYEKVQKQKTEQQTEQQIVYCLTGLYRGITNQAATKNRVETRDGSFELSRKRELMVVLDASEIKSQEEREKAVPLIQEYVKKRQEITDTLKDIRRLGKAGPSELEKLENYENAHVNSGKPYVFLEKTNFVGLEKMGEALRVDNEEMSKKLATLVKLVKEEYISNGNKIVATLEQIKQSGKADAENLLKLKKYTEDLKNPEFLEGKSVDDLIKMGEELRDDNEKMSAKLLELEKQAELERQAALEKHAESEKLNKKLQELSVQDKISEKPKLSTTQKISALFQIPAFFRGIFRSKPPTLPTTPETGAPIAPSLRTRLLSLKKKQGHKQPQQTREKEVAPNQAGQTLVFSKSDSPSSKIDNKTSANASQDAAVTPTPVTPEKQKPGSRR